MFWVLAVTGLMTGLIGVVLIFFLWKMLSTHKKHVDDEKFLKQIRDNADAARRIIKERCNKP